MGLFADISEKIANALGKKKESASPQFNTMSYDPGTQQYTTKMKNGGTASSRADGIAQRGKTKGRMV
jgi:hypothetical protein